jgi:hypothetical protein
MKFVLSLLLGLTAGVLAQEPPAPAPPPVPATPGEEATTPPSVPEPVPSVTEVSLAKHLQLHRSKVGGLILIRSLLPQMIRSTRLTF